MMQDVFEISIAYDFELLVMMMRCVRVRPGTVWNDIWDFKTLKNRKTIYWLINFYGSRFYT